MVYAVSDMHGCFDKYQKLLEALALGPGDTLYVLGDMIDRGPKGFQIMLDMARRPNIIGLLGNHEAMAIDALPCILRAVQADGGASFTREESEMVELWFFNGGKNSLADYLCLDAEQQQTVWKYMCQLPLYREVEAGGKRFVLVHGGLEAFSPARPLEDYAPEEILWCRPTPDTAYYADRYVIYGHTPVQLLGVQKAGAPAVIFQNGNAIDIDCGCVFSSGRLGCLCLDTMEEIYI